MNTEQNANTNSPHRAVLSNEDPAEYVQILNQLRAVYLPLNSLAASVVRDIAATRWQILRFESLLANQWELSLSPQAPPAALAAIHRFNRQIDQLNLRIARLERRVNFIHTHFPNESPLPVEDTPVDDQNNPKIEKNIFVNDTCPETIAHFRRYYPKSPIIITPSGGVPNVPPT